MPAAMTDVTAAEFLGPLGKSLTARAKTLKISQLDQLRKEMAKSQPRQGELETLSLADLHSIRDAFAPYVEGDVSKINAAATACCCCCCPCCCCGCACSSCTA